MMRRILTRPPSGFSEIKARLMACSSPRSELLLVLIGFNRMRDVQAELAELLPERLAGNSEQPGCLPLTSLRVVEYRGQEQAIHLPMRVGVQVRGVGAQSLLDELTESQI